MTISKKKVLVRWRDIIKWHHVPKNDMKVWNGVLYFTNATGDEVALADGWMWEDE